MIKIVNCTPHTINILREVTASRYEEILVIPPSGFAARLEVGRKETDNITFANGTICGDGLGGIGFYESVFGKPSGLPDQEDDTIFIVSGLFRSGFDRPDLWQPGELIRDEKGQPIGCLGLSR